MTDNSLIDAAFERAEAAFERAVQQSLRTQEADFQKLAEQVLADLAELAIEKILSGVSAESDAGNVSATALGAAIAGAAARGGRFL